MIDLVGHIGLGEIAVGIVVTLLSLPLGDGDLRRLGVVLVACGSFVFLCAPIFS